MDYELHREVLNTLVSVLEKSLKDNKMEITRASDLTFYARKAYVGNHPDVPVSFNVETKIITHDIFGDVVRQQRALDRYNRFCDILFAYINEFDLPNSIVSYEARNHLVFAIKNKYLL